MKRNSRRASPAPFGAMIAARQVQPSAKGDDITAKFCSARAQLKADSTDDELFDQLNATVVGAESIDELCLGPLLSASNARRRCDAIRSQYGRHGFDGLRLQAMLSASKTACAIARSNKCSTLSLNH